MLLKKITILISVIVLLLTIITGCFAEPEQDIYPVFISYLDIPGITGDEIAAIERIRARHSSLIYGMEATTECFIKNDGSIGGFAALITDWLGGLFDIPFIPVIYEWDELLAGLESGDIDFTGDLTPTTERMQIYHMTSPIVARPVVMMWPIDSPPPAEVTPQRPMRYIFTDEAVSYGLSLPFLEEHREVYFVTNNAQAYELMVTGRADMFIEEAPYEAYFDKYGSVTAQEFFPLINSTVSITTRNDELSVIINIIQKALDNGARRYLTELYTQGYHQYLREKFASQLTESERAYIQAQIDSGRKIPIGMEFDNYPTSFYNKRENAWQGIAFDVLAEIEKLTDLSFIIEHSSETIFADLLDMLERGEVSAVSEVIPTTERESRFLFSVPYASDYYALISLSELDDAELNDILYLRVGLQREVAYTEVFWEWFPNHSNTMQLDDALKALEALENREIDFYMGTRKLLLQATNYMEMPWFKTNIVFNRGYDSAFGINLNEPELQAIINKAMPLINTKRINEQWVTRVFNYQSALARARMPYLIGLSALMICVIGLLAVMFIRGRRLNVILSTAVAKRTHELEEQMKVAVTASESKSRFLATMSHEIRTPLNAIIGITQIELQNKDNPGADSFEKIYSSGISLLGIINDILDMSKIETGKLELNLAEYELADLINDAVQLNIIRIGEKPIEFILDIDENIPARLIGDELRLKQILNNLLSNAFKYTERGHIRLEVHMNDAYFAHDYNSVPWIASGADDEVELVFTVEDTGCGLKPDDLDKLFTEYLRFYAAANRTTEGTGLGLNITKKLVDLMGGTINAKSKYGKGTAFIVTVKQKTAGTRVIGAEVAQNLHALTYNSGGISGGWLAKRYPMPYGSVLVVDDVESNLFVAEGLLAPYKLNVETVDSGFAAIERIESGASYDIIFMDHMMPHMDGIETTKRLRQSGYKGTIIALTANALTGNDEMFKENGFDCFIPKPVDIEHLDNVLNKYVRDRHPDEAGKYEPEVSERAEVPAISAKLLNIFCREAESAAMSMREAVDTGDAKKVASVAHAMKSALANVQQRALSAAAAELERAGNSNDNAYIEANAGVFVAKLEELISTINNEKENSKETEQTLTEDTELLREQLKIIISACDDYDDTRAYAALDLLDAGKWNSDTAGILTEIRDSLFLDSDFEKALMLAKSKAESL